jgi:hypothetical protein
VGVLFAVFGLLALIVGSAWIGTKTALVPSILVLERFSLRAAIARSWRLTRLNFWRVFGTIALVGIIVSAAGNIVSAPVTIFGQFAGGLFPSGGASSGSGMPFGGAPFGSMPFGGTPFGSSGGSHAIALGIGRLLPVLIASAAANLVSVIITAVGVIVQSATVALLYIDLRIRSERLDLELVRYVKLRDEGVTPLPDPYRPAPFGG